MAQYLMFIFEFCWFLAQDVTNFDHQLKKFHNGTDTITEGGQLTHFHPIF